MKRSPIYFMLIIFPVLLALAYYYIHDNMQPSWVYRGVIDLSKTDFEKKGTVALNGEWEFYWDQLLVPEDFKNRDSLKPQYIQVPGNWKRDLQGNSYPPKGIATFRATIENLPKGSYFGLKKANIRSSSRIYVNGDLVLEDGTPAESPQDMVGGNQSKLTFFEVEGKTAEVVIQAANFDYIVSGIAKPLIFGEQRTLMNQHYRHVLFEYTMIIIVLLIGLFYLFLFMISKSYRSREPVTLPLALSCIFYGLMSSTYSERILDTYLPDLSLNFNFRFGHLMSVLSVIMVLFVINKVNKAYLSNRIRNGLVAIYTVFIILLSTFPMDFYLQSIPFYLVLTVGAFLLILLRVISLFVRVSASKNMNMEHWALIVSTFCVILYWFDNCLYSLGVKDNMYLSFISIAIYSSSLAALLIARYVHSYRQNEELTEKLIETFSTLDQTTKAAQRNEIAFLQAQIKPHFLFNSLSSIISLCYTNGERAAKLLTELSNYLKRSFGINLNSDFVTIENELALIQSYVEIEKARFGDRIRMDYDIDPEVLPLKIMPLVIEPLVENAIRHCVLHLKNGGKVKLTIKKQDETIHICVENNGSGIDARTLSEIQNQETDRVVSHGHGISLKNINARLYRLYQVKLNFYTHSEGTKVMIQIPLTMKENREETDVDSSRDRG